MHCAAETLEEIKALRGELMNVDRDIVSVRMLVVMERVVAEKA